MKMKNMTITEKAKTYDEALKVGKKLILTT